MPAADGVTIALGSWRELGPAATELRFAVFVVEQKVPPEMELDEHDPVSLHALARDEAGAVIGTGRLLPDGHIGRIAVAAGARGRGVGDALMRALLHAAQARELPEVVLSAQTHATRFYERLGFVAEGDAYDDCGIPHVTMRMALPAREG